MALSLADRSALQAPFPERIASNQKVVGVISSCYGIHKIRYHLGSTLESNPPSLSSDIF